MMEEDVMTEAEIWEVFQLLVMTKFRAALANTIVTSLG